MSTCARKGCDADRDKGRYCNKHHYIWAEKRRNTFAMKVFQEQGKVSNWDAQQFMCIAHRCTQMGKALELLPPLDGRIVCVDCGSAAVYWDHRDYLKPYDVVPICASCNVFRGAAAIPSKNDFAHLWALLG